MAIFARGAIIRELRKSKRLTLEELSEGICSAGTLSRIEKDEIAPSGTVFQALLEKLGEDAIRHYTSDPPYIKWYPTQLNYEIRKLLEKEDEESNLKAEELICEGEKVKLFPDEHSLRNWQLLQRHKAHLSFNRKEYETAYKHAFEALKVFFPDFCEETISQFCFMYIEIDLLIIIATSQYYLISPEKSTEIYINIIASLKNCLIIDEDIRELHIKILYNLSENYGLYKEYEKCISVCDEGIKLSEAANDFRFYPLFLFNKGWCFLYLNEIKQGMVAMNRAYALFYGTHSHREIAMMENFLKEFNITLEELRDLPEDYFE